MQHPDSYQYEYPRPAVTTDCVIFGFDGAGLNVLLVERGIEPFAGQWALPGGFIDMEEDADTCAMRILKNETGLDHIYMEQLYTFSGVERDPRYRVISIAYYALINMADHIAQAGTDTSRVRWFPMLEVPKLAFDHDDILNTAYQRLKGKITYQPIGFELLPEKFTLPELHNLYETVLQTQLDRRNFRKKMLSYGLLIDHGAAHRGTPHRAPILYSFDKDRYEALSREGFFFTL